MVQKTDLKKGIFFAFVTSIISGVAIFYSKISLVKITPIALTTSRNLLVAFLFVAYFILSGKLKKIKELKKKELINLVLIGIVGGALPFYLFFTGLSMVGAQTANLIHKTLFIWVSFLAILFLKEKPNAGYWLGFILVVIASFYFTSFKISFGRGELMVLAATLLWAGENILAKKILARVTSEMVGLFRMGIGSSILLLSLIINGQLNSLLTLNNQQLTTVLIGGSILFFYINFWYKALRYAPASLVALMLTFSLVIGNLLTVRFTEIKIITNEIYASLLIFAVMILFIIQFFNIKSYLKNFIDLKQ